MTMAGRQTSGRPDVYAEVTSRMIEALENGTVPWHQPWSGGRPRSMSTGRPYRGVNTLLLVAASLEGGYVSPFWGTYRQIAELGGQVRRGEKSSLAVLWKSLEVAERDAGTGEEQVRTIPLLRSFRLFNAAQADGLPGRFTPAAEPEQFEDAGAVTGCYLADGGPQLRHVAQGRAFYTPKTDVVTLPLASQFEDAGAYSQTLFHELGHSTGHPSRLDRPGIAQIDHFGSERYSKEELTAEMTAAMLCARTGTEGRFGASASYIAGWLEQLRGDRKLVVSAAAQAERAATLICPEREARLVRAEPDAGFEMRMSAPDPCARLADWLRTWGIWRRTQPPYAARTRAQRRLARKVRARHGRRPR